MHAGGNFTHAPEARDVIHVDEVEHAPSVPELGAVVEVRFRENATVSFVPMVWGHDEPRIANLRRDRVKQNPSGRSCVKESNKATYMRGSPWVIRLDL